MTFSLYCNNKTETAGVSKARYVGVRVCVFHAGMLKSNCSLTERSH